MRLPRISVRKGNPVKSAAPAFVVPIELDEGLGTVLDQARMLGSEIAMRVICSSVAGDALCYALEQELQQAAFEFGKLGFPPVIAGLAHREVREAAQTTIEKTRSSEEI